MSLRAALLMIRPINCAMIGFAVIVGAFVSKPALAGVPELAFGFLTGFSVCAYSMVINDYYDIEVDRVNQPDRPLPSGRVGVRAALALAACFLAVGLAASAITGLAAAFAVAVLYALLSWFYNFRAKKFGIIGNSVVASSLAIPFIYGGVVTRGDLVDSLLLFMALTSFLAGVGREVVKAMADIPGDEKRGVRSVAISHGLRCAASVGAALFLLAVLTSIVPVLRGETNLLYRVGVVVPDAIFVYLAASILGRATPANALTVKRNALFGMLVGLIVFIGGAF